MKKLIFVACIGCLSLLNAGNIWDIVKNQGSDGTIKTKQYEMEVAGVNTRAYVFTVKEMDSVCVLTYSTQGIPAINCKTRREMGLR